MIPRLSIGLAAYDILVVRKDDLESVEKELAQVESLCNAVADLTDSLGQMPDWIKTHPGAMNWLRVQVLPALQKVRDAVTELSQ